MVAYVCGMARTVLVVDDSSAFRATARMLLQARGYDVVGVAEDVASGLAKAAELRPDCVLMRAPSRRRRTRRAPARR